MSDHLRDPLDYLYEELASEGMAEVRRHLAECPDCRADMRAVRETVKAYRRAGGPTVPDGLAVRAAMKALEAARAAEAEAAAAPPAPDPVPVVAAPVAPAPPPRTPAPPSPSLEKVTEGLEQVLRIEQSRVSTENLEKEYRRIREDVLGEVQQKTWRTWFFHPAWTVAASVVFICALLMHISPRMNRPGYYPPSVPARDDAATRQIRERERLPAAAPKQREAPAPIPAEAPIVLREAEAMNEPPALPALPAPAPSPARAQPSPRMARDAAVPAAAASPAPPAPVPPPEEPAVPQSQPALAAEASVAAEAEPAAAAEPDAGEEPAVPEIDASVLTESLEEFLPEGAVTSGGDAPVIVDMLQMEPPHLIERPTPINVPERIQSLTTLAGMQMANGEFEDAWASVRLLEAYDTDAARNLAEILTGMEEAAKARREEAVADAEAVAAGETAAAPAAATEAAPALESPPLQSGPAPEAVAMPEPVEAPVPEPSPEPAASPIPSEPSATPAGEAEPVPPAEPAAPEPSADRGTGENEVFRPLSPSPEMVEPVRRRALVPATPPPPLPTVARIEPERSPARLMDGWVASPQAIASAGPPPDAMEMIPAPAHPDPDVAVETVLWVQEPVIVQQYSAPTASRKTSPRRTPFSTDPYVRGY
ncbi:MAG: zf-HC2 domain-containing protein [Planctomycetaceae bacterium]|nr:zf-HC2 domain-containing protein [Planctomycetaceae bacterium]